MNLVLFLLFVIADPVLQPPSERLQRHDRLVPVTFESEALAGRQRYLAWLPPSYREDAGDYPVVVLLHGLGGEGADWFAPGLGDLRPVLGELLRDRRIDPFVALAPDGGSGYWTDHLGEPRKRYGAFIDEVIADADGRFAIATDRAAIVGVSMGGHGAMSRALMEPTRYRGVVSMAGALFEEPPTHRTIYQQVWGYPADPGHWRATAPVALMRRLTRGGPAPSIFLSCGRGDRDRFLPLTEAASRLLDGRGIRHELMLTDGGHTWSAWRASFGRWLQWLRPRLR